MNCSRLSSSSCEGLLCTLQPAVHWSTTQTVSSYYVVQPRSKSFFYINCDGFLMNLSRFQIAHTLGFDAANLQPINIAKLLMRLTRSVVIFGFKFTEALNKVLTKSPILGMHTGVMHLAWKELTDGAGWLEGRKYVWTHHESQPWGQKLPIQCPECGTMQKWNSIYQEDSSYKFECTYSKCGYLGADRKGWRHQIIVQCPEGAVMLPKCSGGKGAWMRTPIKLGLA